MSYAKRRRAEAPGTPPFWIVRRMQRPKGVYRGGWFYRHANREGTDAEAQRLAARFAGARFVVLDAIVSYYGFTSAPILSALVAAKRRSVDVEVILDKTNDRTAKNTGDAEDETPTRGNRYTGATYMANAGVPVFIDFHPAIAHNKVIVIDNHLVIGGSYNYTASAEQRNAENVTFVDSPEVASRYLMNWLSRKEASRAFGRSAP